MLNYASMNINLSMHFRDASWATCGWKVGHPLDTDKVVIDRAAELFHQRKAVPEARSRAAVVLQAVQNASPKKLSCVRWSMMEMKFVFSFCPRIMDPGARCALICINPH